MNSKEEIRLKKIDIHLHLTLQQYPKTDTMFLSSAAQMLPHLEELGIEQGIVLSSGEQENEQILVAANEECKRICEQFPKKFHWMCNVDAKNQTDVYKRILACKESGAVGIGELMVNQRLDAPFLQSVFEVAEELKLPVLFHMSPKEGFQYGVVDGPGLPLLEENLKRYKGLKFIGNSQPFWHEISKDAPATPKERMKWGEGAVCPGGRLPYLFETYENLYGDLSANSGGCAIMRDEEFGLAFLEKYQDRLLFGTDMANCEMTFPLGNWLDEQEHAGRLSRSAYEKICRTNAEKLFHL